MPLTPPPPGPLGRQRVWAVAGVVAAGLLIFAACSDSFRPAGFRYGDLVDYSLPRADYVGQALAQGRLPLWDAEVGGGVDTLASPLIMLFYPPNWIHAVLPARTGMGVLVVAHLLLLGLAFQAWLRGRGLEALPSLLVSACLMLALSGMAWWPHMLFSLSWLPVMLWRMDAPGRAGAGRWASLAGAYAMMVLAGHPQLLAYSTLLLAAYAGVQSLGGRTLRPAVILVLAVAGGGAAAAVQVVPTKLHLDSLSWRPLGTLDRDVAHYLEGGVPAEHKLSQMGRVLLNTLDNRQRERWLCNRFSCGYLGSLAPLAVLAALWRRPDRQTVFWLVVAGAGLYLATGFSPGLAPLYDVLARVPVLGAFRTPDRFILWFLLGWAVLAGGGMQRIWQSREGGSWRWAVLLAAGAMIAVRVAMWQLLDQGRAGEVAVWAAGVLAVGHLAWCRPAGLTGGARAAATRVGAGAFEGPRSRRRRLSRIVAAGVLLAATGIDFWQTSAYVCPFFRDQPQQAVLQSGDWTRSDRVLLQAPDVHAMNRLAGQEPLFRWYVGATYMPVMRDRSFPAYRSLPYYEGLQLRRDFELDRRLFNVRWPRHAMLWGLPPLPHRRLMDLCSVGALVTPEPLGEEAPGAGWQGAGRLPGGAWAYRNAWALPRFSLQDRWQVMGEEQIVEALLAEASAPPEAVMLLEAPVFAGGPARSSASRPAAATAPTTARAAGGAGGPAGRVDVLADRDEHVAVRAECDRPCLLLVSDSHAPGWRCTVDGLPARILRANYLHRAIELTPGTHTVEMRYVPPGLGLGAAISAAGVALIAGLALWARLRHCRLPIAVRDDVGAPTTNHEDHQDHKRSPRRDHKEKAH